MSYLKKRQDGGETYDVGLVTPDGHWHVESTGLTLEAAGARVAWLNGTGGDGIDPTALMAQVELLNERLEAMEAAIAAVVSELGENSSALVGVLGEIRDGIDEMKDQSVVNTTALVAGMASINVTVDLL